jgi:NTE family protein
MDVTLALGGGGVKGYAHIGVLRALDAKGIKIRAIAGTSIGGLMGAIYAAGVQLENAQERLKLLDQSKLYSRMPGDGPSLLGMGGVVETLQDILGNRRFEDLSIPLVMTAVDIESGQPVVINQGPLIDAILATTAVPGIFPSRTWNGRNVVDGGILNPVPVTEARSLAPRLPVVAVVLSPAISSWKGNQSPPGILASIPFLNHVYKLRLAQSIRLFLRSIDISGCMLTDLRLQMEKPEVIIRPIVNQIGLIDTVDIPEVIELGEQAAEAALPQLDRWSGTRTPVENRLPWISPQGWSGRI